MFSVALALGLITTSCTGTPDYSGYSSVTHAIIEHEGENSPNAKEIMAINEETSRLYDQGKYEEARQFTIETVLPFYQKIGATRAYEEKQERLYFDSEDEVHDQIQTIADASHDGQILTDWGWCDVTYHGTAVSSKGKVLGTIRVESWNRNSAKFKVVLDVGEPIRYDVTVGRYELIPYTEWRTLPNPK